MGGQNVIRCSARQGSTLCGDTLDHALQFMCGCVAQFGPSDLAVLEEDECGEGLDVVLIHKAHVVRAIDLHDAKTVAETILEFLQHWFHGNARAAGIAIYVDKDRHFAAENVPKIVKMGYTERIAAAEIPAKKK